MLASVLRIDPFRDTLYHKMASNAGILPPSLKGGEALAIVAPSGRLNALFPHRIERAKEFFAGGNHPIKVIFNEKLSDDHLTSIKERCEELHAAFRDPEIKAVICAIGGLSANELLPHLDYDLIRANPKIFCGYSDITLLHYAIFSQTGLRTFYGPAALTQWAEYPMPQKFTLMNFFDIVTGRANSSVIPKSEAWTQEFLDWATEAEHSRARETNTTHPRKWLREGKAQGRLFGGCLPSVLQLFGTKYCIDHKDVILILETPEHDKPDSNFGLDFARSAMADLRNYGVLDQISGMVIGRPFQYSDKEWADFEHMILDQCYGTDFPILFNVDVGHTDPILTLPLNALVSLDSTKDEFALLEAVVET